MEEDCVWPQRLLTMGQEEEEEVHMKMHYSVKNLGKIEKGIQISPKYERLVLSKNASKSVLNFLRYFEHMHIDTETGMKNIAFLVQVNIICYLNVVCSCTSSFVRTEWRCR